MGIGELVRKINHDGYSDVAGTNKSIIMSDCSFSNINTSYSEDHGIRLLDNIYDGILEWVQ